MIKFYRRSRFHYWSCSKISDLIRGKDKPVFGTTAEWDIWENNSSQSKPFRHWLAEYGLSRLQTIINIPADIIYSIGVYWSNRFKTQTHVLPTNLEIGQWHEYEERLLYGMFESFCYFIEVEQAETDKPSRPDGMAHLIWASHLRHGEDDYTSPDNERFAQLTSQAKNAVEQMRLYIWWRDERPARVDPWNSDLQYGQIFDTQAQHNQEDEDMMIALVKIRNGLWT